MSRMMTCFGREDGHASFEAIDKKLVPKPELRKRPLSIIVIDRLEQKPSEHE